jgi:hypothetical protein
LADFNTPNNNRGDLGPKADIDQLMDQLFGNSPTIGSTNFPFDDTTPFITPKIPIDPDDANLINPERLATAEESVSTKYQLEKDNAEFFGAELLEIVKEQLPDGVTLDKPRFLGANREGIMENGGVVVAVSFVLNDEDFSGRGTHYLPDPSVFEPRVEEEDPSADGQDSSPDVIYEVEDADPENPDAPRRLRQRAPKMSGSGRTVATLAAMNGNVEEVFEPVDTHARVILVDKGNTVEVQVVFGATTEVPDSVIDRLVATSPKESLEIPTDRAAAGATETAEQMYHRLKDEGKQLYDIMPEMEAAGFSEDDILPLLRAKGKRPAPAAAQNEPSYTAGDFPVEEVSHPFSFGRVKLDNWAAQYLESAEGYYPGAALTIRNIERLEPDSNTLSVTLQMPETENGIEVRRLTLEPTLDGGKMGFRVHHTETLELGEYIASRREDLGIE